MLIRAAQRDDVPALLEISNEAAETTIANFATEPESLADWQAQFDSAAPRHAWFVAERGGAVAGFARSGPWKSRGAYDRTAEVSVYVQPTAQHCGVGRALYTKLLQTLRSRELDLLLAGIALPNAASVRLHESFGFEPCARFERIGFKFGAWHDVGYWSLRLR